MKTLKKLLALTITLALAASLTACCCLPLDKLNKASKIEGVWEGELLGIDMIFTFEDGEVELTVDAYGYEETNSTTYEFDGTTLIIDDEEVEFEFEDNDTLILYLEDMEIELERK